MFRLPNANLRNFPTKILFDFTLLMCVSQQMLVFRIEERYKYTEYPGGSNKSIVKAISAGKIPTTVHNFVSIQKNFLDIYKCVVFFGCFWATMATLFLAGTKNHNIYSIGYLIGCFIFLWQTNEFYLQPINTILRWWRLLVVYNIFVITSKPMLRLLYCHFTPYLNRFSHFNEIFDITCADEASNDVSTFLLYELIVILQEENPFKCIFCNRIHKLQCSEMAMFGILCVSCS